MVNVKKYSACIKLVLPCIMLNIFYPSHCVFPCVPMHAFYNYNTFFLTCTFGKSFQLLTISLLLLKNSRVWIVHQYQLEIHRFDYRNNILKAVEHNKRGISKEIISSKNECNVSLRKVEILSIHGLLLNKNEEVVT